jgi:hypothetical protein
MAVRRMRNDCLDPGHVNALSVGALARSQKVRGELHRQRPASNIKQQARRIFQRFFHGDQAQNGFAAVDDAVVVAHGEVVDQVRSQCQLLYLDYPQIAFHLKAFPRAQPAHE